MKVLLILKNNPSQGYLVKLHTDKLIDEVKKLIGRRQHSRAIMTALAGGMFEKEVFEHEMPSLEADLILSRTSAHWDLM